MAGSHGNSGGGPELSFSCSLRKTDDVPGVSGEGPHKPACPFFVSRRGWGTTSDRRRRREALRCFLSQWSRGRTMTLVSDGLKGGGSESL